MVGWGTGDDEHPVGFVTVLGVVAREVDVPSAVEGVEFGGPEVAGVFLVWGWTPGRISTELHNCFG